MKKADGTGVIVPLFTPLNRDESIDFAGLRRLVDHVIAGGVDAVLVMGSTGEFARFDHDDRKTLVEAVVKNVGGRVPVYAGVGDTGLEWVKRNAAMAERAGADAIACTLSYYYPLHNEEEQYIFYSSVAKATKLPVMLYNIPSTCIASVGFGVIERMLEFDNVIGIKDSGGDRQRLLDELARFAHKARPFTVVIGNEELSYDGFTHGADGVVPSMANPFPKLWADLYRAAKKKDHAALRTLCDLADEFTHLGDFAKSWMSGNVWRKKALEHLGICKGHLTAPHVPLDADTNKRIADAVEKYGELYR